MRIFNQRGGVNVFLILFILVLLLLFGAIGFGFWAFMGRQDYKNNVDPKIATAVEIAKKETASTKDNEFLEREKQPLKRYNGPGTYGSVTITYPKTWSAYIAESNAGPSANPVDGYFHPNFVPGLQTTTSYALRLQVLSTSYDQVLKQFDALTKSGKVKISAYSAPKVPGTVGARVNGEISTGKKGSIVLFPLRDKTLKIWTEADQFIADFNNNILPNLTYIP